MYPNPQGDKQSCRAVHDAMRGERMATLHSGRVHFERKEGRKGEKGRGRETMSDARH